MQELSEVLELGEGQKIEFKQAITKNLDREIVAFANAVGGVIYLGVADNGQIVGIKQDNSTMSQIQTIAYECDPSIKIHCEKLGKDIIAIHVLEGSDKPYRCRDGFFLRIGANTQKLKRDEIIELLQTVGKVRFDEMYNHDFNYPDDFSSERFEAFLKLAQIEPLHNREDLLINLGVARHHNECIELDNAGILFFAKDPQKHIRESYISCVRYQSEDRLTIIDKQEIQGGVIDIIEGAMHFIMRHMSVALVVEDLQHREISDYPLIAIREAIINAVMHRDYYYDASHIYVHMFSNRLEIENPGGLLQGMTIEDLGRRSVRRNSRIADLLMRAKYVERVGSGFIRMKSALNENLNPPLEVNSSNYFVIRFLPRVFSRETVQLTERQLRLIQYIKERNSVTKAGCMIHLALSGDTVLRTLNELIVVNLIEKIGIGKKTSYRIKQ